MTNYKLTPLTTEEQLDAASNYLCQENSDIPAWTIAHLIAEAAEEHLEEFTTAPVVSPRITKQIEQTIAEYRQSEQQA